MKNEICGMFRQEVLQLPFFSRLTASKNCVDTLMSYFILSETFPVITTYRQCHRPLTSYQSLRDPDYDNGKNALSLLFHEA
jgi:hypothetical protein